MLLLKRFVSYSLLVLIATSVLLSIFSNYNPDRFALADNPPAQFTGTDGNTYTCTGLDNGDGGNYLPVINITDNMTFSDASKGIDLTDASTVAPTEDVLTLEDTVGTTPTVIYSTPTSAPDSSGITASYTVQIPCLSVADSVVVDFDNDPSNLVVISALTGTATPLTDSVYNAPGIGPASLTMFGVDTKAGGSSLDPYSGCYSSTTVSVACPPSGTEDTSGNPVDGTNNCYLKTGSSWEEVSCITLTTAGLGTPTPGDAVTNTATTCETTGSPLTWILCPVFDMISSFSQWVLTDIIQPFLAVSPVSTSPANGSYQVWSQFRVYGNIVLVIGLLILVFAEVIGGGVIDAYTIKKILPRILIAVILINLSIYIVAALIDISNVVGGSIANLMLEPYKVAGGLNFHLNGGQQAGVFSVGILGAVLGSAGLAGFVFGVLGGSFIGIALEAGFFLILPVLLGALAVFFTLIARQGIILFLIIISPIAFALYCLPNTEQYFKQWWKLLLECLLVYPIVMIIFAVSDILSMTILQANDVTVNTGGFVVSGVRETLAAVIAFILQFIPLFAAPFAFRIAGGTLGRMNELFSNVGKNINKLADGRRQQVNARYNSQALSGRTNALKRLRGVTDKQAPENATTRQKVGLGLRKAGAGLLASRISGYNLPAAMSAEQARVGKEVNDQIATGEDSEIRGSTVNMEEALKHDEGTEWRYTRDANGNIVEDAKGNRTRQFKTLGGGWVSESDVKAGQGRWGGNQFAQQATLSYEMRKALTDDDRTHLAENYDNVALKSWGMTTGQASGAWTGASFENQNNNLQFKYIKRNGPVNPETGVRDVTFDSKGFVDEVFEKRGTYPMSQMDATTINRMTAAYNQSVETGDTVTQQKLQTIASSMSGRMGAAGGGSPQVISGEGGETSLAAGGATGAAGHVSQAIDEFIAVAGPPRSPQNRGNGGPGGPRGGGRPSGGAPIPQGSGTPGPQSSGGPSNSEGSGSSTPPARAELSPDIMDLDKNGNPHREDGKFMSNTEAQVDIPYYADADKGASTRNINDTTYSDISAGPGQNITPNRYVDAPELAEPPSGGEAELPGDDGTPPPAPNNQG